MVGQISGVNKGRVVRLAARQTLPRSGAAAAARYGSGFFPRSVLVARNSAMVFSVTTGPGLEFVRP